MHTKRIEQMLLLAQAQGLDAIALLPGPNLFAVTGLSFHMSERPIVGLFPVDQPPALVAPALEAGKAREIEVFPYTDEEGYTMAFHEACATLELADARIGVEGLRMRLLEARILQRYAAGSELVPADDLFAELRLRKGAAELSALRQAIAVAETAFLDWLHELHVGMTEKEAAARLMARLLTGGADTLAFEPIVVGGPNGANPHAVPGTRPFEEGDWVVVDWGAYVDGFPSDITRMVVFGEPAGPLVDIQALVMRANHAGRAAAGPGVLAEDVDRAARDLIVRGGYGPEFNHRTGHGLGLEVHEPPYIVAGNQTPLEPGMTFTVEPGIYVSGLGGVRIEDDVVVTPGGSETLTSLSRDPFVVRR
ncbi:MAG: aminopeptidase P family protein [Anaerolineae bacterium]|nr:aminopeptidase P family protein [Anaerolineae bacterium]